MFEQKSEKICKICSLPGPQKFPPMGTIATINARNKRLFCLKKRCLFPKSVA